jgi:hypothetical protein
VRLRVALTLLPALLVEARAKTAMSVAPAAARLAAAALLRPE